MASRIRVLRKISNPPIINGFKPYGQQTEKPDLESVNLLYEEYEAMRLSDYNKLNHHQASVQMGVSRPTFTRIYATALQKVALAFVEGRQITIKGGEVYFESNWYHCTTCKSYFSNPQKDKTVENCSLCGSQQFNEFDYTYDNTSTKKCNDIWICPNCKFEQKSQQGKNCNQKRCPTCNVVMKPKL